VLDSILARLPRQTDPNVLVGYATSDDAGVYRLSDELALVQTVDFFTPIVDDPYLYGQIAAANSLSDVYAMGGRPLTALAVLALPEKSDLEVAEKILAGGLDKMIEAACTVVGGHSIRDDELKFGYAVTGTLHPRRIWTNAGARPGDRLLLTKPLGTGVITTALKKGAAREAWVEAAVRSMAELNRAAAEALLPLGDAIHAVTDITGFGLLGHAREVAVASSVSLVIDSAQIEFIAGALECAHAGHLAGGLKNNREFLGGPAERDSASPRCVEFADHISPDVQALLYDPQTSGGLLVAVPPDEVEHAQQVLRAAGCAAAHLGEVLAKTSPLIAVR
jgi:selenide,water dikinase